VLATLVCETCAELIANRWWDARSGRWLTWPNEPRPKPIYVKAVIGNALRTAVFERDTYRCVDCGTWRGLTADHIVPEVNGGPTVLENLATRCRPCNSRKGVSDGR
jgi:hypothetical protein